MATRFKPASHAILLILFALGASRSDAAFTLDQSNVVPAFSFDAAVASQATRAQTFTVGITGTLAEVDFQIYKSPNTVNDPTFQILGTTNGAPDPSKVLYQTTISLNSIPTYSDTPMGVLPFTSVDVSGAGLAVTSGQVLALVLSRTGPGNSPWLLWRYGAPTYGGGTPYFSSSPTGPFALQSGSYDAGFQTYVSPAAAVPEPASIALAATGLSLLLAPAARGKRRPRPAARAPEAASTS